MIIVDVAERRNVTFSVRSSLANGPAAVYLYIENSVMSPTAVPATILLLASDSTDGGCTALAPANFSQVGCLGCVRCATFPLWVSTTAGNPRLPMIAGAIDVAANCAAVAPSVLVSFTVSSRIPLVVEALYSYAANMTTYSHGVTPTTEAALRSASNGWRGAQNVTVTSETTVRLVTSRQQPATTRLVSYVASSGGDIGKPLNISAVTSPSVMCRINDLRSFAAVPVAAAASLASNYSLQCTSAGSVAQWTYPEELQRTCLEDPSCVGYVTGAVASGTSYREEGLCLVYAGLSPVDPSIGIERLLLRKSTAAERTCEITIDSAGMASIYLQQTYFGGSGLASVYAGDTFLAACGGAKPFAGGVLGMSSQCDTWALCYTGPASSGTVYRVVADVSLSQGGCQNSLGVLAAVEFGYYTSAPVPQQKKYLTGLREAFVESITVHKSADEGTVVTVFALNVARVLLQVVQSGHSCAGRPASACSPAIATVQLERYDAAGSGAVDLLQRCGATAPFVFNTSGVNDQCTTAFYCDVPSVPQLGTLEHSPPTSSQPQLDPEPGVALSGTIGAEVLENETAYLFSGWLRIAADTTAIARLSSGACPSLLGSIDSSPWPSNALVNTPTALQGGMAPTGFPLRDDALGSSFRALLMPPRGAANVSFLVSGRSVTYLPHLGDMLSVDSPRDAYMVNWSSAAGGAISAPVDLGCVMDYLGEASASCTLPRPAAANFVTVSVTQTFMTANSITVDLLAINETTGSVATIATRRCGGTRGFAGLPSQDGKCRTFLPCFVGPLKIAGSSVSATHVRVTAPHGVGTGDFCPYAFASIAHFETRMLPNATVALTSQTLVCDADFTAVQLQSICDNVLDCPDGQDEALCFVWYAVEWDVVPLPATGAAENTTNVTFGLSECRSRAIAIGTTVFAISANRSWCILYQAAAIASMVADPLSFAFGPAPGFTVYAQLLEGPLSYARCSARLSCSGHGSLVADLGRSGQCTCTCDPSFTGDDCSTAVDLAFVGPVAVVLPASSLATGDDVAAALQASSAASVSVSCTPYQAVSPGRRSTTCAASSRIASERVIFRDDVRRRSTGGSVAAALGENGADVEVFDSTLAASRLYNCSMNASGGHCQGSASAIASLSVTLVASAGIDQIDVTLGWPPIPSFLVQRQRQESVLSFSSPLSPVRFTCSGAGGSAALSVDRSGCVVTTCRVDLASPQVVLTVEVAVSTANSLLGDPCFQPAVVDVSFAITLPRLVYSAVVNTASDFRSYLIGGFAVVVLAVLLTLVGIVLKLVDIRQTAALAGPVVAHGSRLRQQLITTLRRMGYYSDKSRPLKAELWSVGAAVFALNLVIAGIFLVLYFYTSASYSSNVEVLAEAYRSRLCESSPLAPTPMRLIRVSATTSRECTERAVAGISFGSPIFASAFCVDGATIMVKMGLSLAECDAKAYTTVTNGTCIAVYNLVRGLNDSSFVSLRCATTPSVASRFAAAQLVTPGAVSRDDDASYVKSVRQTWRQNVNTARGATFAHPRHQFKRFLLSTSATSATRLEVAASAQSIVGSANGNRLVALLDPDSFVAPAEPYDFPSLDVLEAAFGSNMSQPLEQDALSLGPSNGDYPVGFMYFGFNASNVPWEETVGPESARYYGVDGTSLDVGSLLSGSALGDGDGVTMSMFLRATPDSIGFVFATTDARENLDLGTSPLLARLAYILDFGAGAESWFAANYSVYMALYLEGPSGLLRLLYCNPTGDSTAVVSLKWDLAALGVESLLNGAWHHVAVILRAENGQLKAQLVVDGATSLSRVGWNQCMDRAPWSVQPSAALAGAGGSPVLRATTSDLNERVMTGGMLHVGYFNGGVAGLDITLGVTPLYTLWRTSAWAIFGRHTAEMAAFLALAIVLFACGSAMLCILVTSSVRAAVREHLDRANEVRRQAMERYFNIWSPATADRGKHFERVDCSAYKVPLYGVAKKWAGGYDDEGLAVLLKEVALHYPPTQLRAGLIKTLFCLKLGRVQYPAYSTDLPMPTADEWNELVGEQAEDVPEWNYRSDGRNELDVESDTAELRFRGRSAALSSSTSQDLSVKRRPPHGSPTEKKLPWTHDAVSPSDGTLDDEQLWAEARRSPTMHLQGNSLPEQSRTAVVDFFSDSISLGSIVNMARDDIATGAVSDDADFEFNGSELGDAAPCQFPPTNNALLDFQGDATDQVAALLEGVDFDDWGPAAAATVVAGASELEWFGANDVALPAAAATKKGRNVNNNFTRLDVTADFELDALESAELLFDDKKLAMFDVFADLDVDEPGPLEVLDDRKLAVFDVADFDVDAPALTDFDDKKLAMFDVLADFDVAEPTPRTCQDDFNRAQSMELSTSVILTAAASPKSMRSSLGRGGGMIDFDMAASPMLTTAAGSPRSMMAGRASATFVLDEDQLKRDGSVPQLRSPELSMFVPRIMSGQHVADRAKSSLIGRSALNLSVISVKLRNSVTGPLEMLPDVACYSSDDSDDANHNNDSNKSTHPQPPKLQRARTRDDDQEEAEEREEEKEEAAPEAPDNDTDTVANDGVGLGDLLVPILMVLQSVYVYLSTMSVPLGYGNIFGKVFSALSIDWTQVIGGMPPLVMPLVQLVTGLVALCTLFYLVQSDEHNFAWYLARYTLRRDEAEGGCVVSPEEVLAAIKAPFGTMVDYPWTCLIPIVPLRKAQKLYQFLMQDATIASPEARSARMTLDIGEKELTAFRSGAGSAVVRVRDKHSSGGEMPTSSGAETGLALRIVGIDCPIHGRLLSLQVQTELWPFANRPRCCSTHGGEKGRCGMSRGKMFRCGAHEQTEAGEDTQCTYALCAAHYHGSLADRVRAQVLGSMRAARDGGLRRLITVVALLVATVVYTPFVKTAIMILSCHPYFQCVFGTCWAALSQKFVLAAYLAVVMVAFLGLGFPLVLLLLLRRRQRMMADVFFAPEYGSRFGKAESRIIAHDEWQRFVATDNTALASLYQDFVFERFYISPVLLAWKVVLMSPPIFLETNSFSQLAGCAAAEFLFAIFMFTLSPAISIVINGVYRLGCVHQMIFLGLLSLDNYRRYHGQSSVELYMIGVTVAYLAVCVAVIVVIQLKPPIEETIFRHKMRRTLRRCGIPYSAFCPMYMIEGPTIVTDEG